MRKFLLKSRRELEMGWGGWILRFTGIVRVSLSIWGTTVQSILVPNVMCAQGHAFRRKMVYTNLTEAFLFDSSVILAPWMSRGWHTEPLPVDIRGKIYGFWRLSKRLLAHLYRGGRSTCLLNLPCHYIYRFVCKWTIVSYYFQVKGVVVNLGDKDDDSLFSSALFQ